ARLRPWFLPEQPGPLVAAHVLETGHGACFADRWPDPRTAVFQTGDNFVLGGDPAALMAEDLRQRVNGFVDASTDFEPLLVQVFPTLFVWNRVVLELSGAPPLFRLSTPATLRPLVPEDVQDVRDLTDDLTWISNTWDGPTGLVAGGKTWGAYVDER